MIAMAAVPAMPAMAPVTAVTCVSCVRLMRLMAGDRTLSFMTVMGAVLVCTVLVAVAAHRPVVRAAAVIVGAATRAGILTGVGAVGTVGDVARVLAVAGRPGRARGSAGERLPAGACALGMPGLLIRADIRAAVRRSRVPAGGCVMVLMRSVIGAHTPEGTQPGYSKQWIRMGVADAGVIAEAGKRRTGRCRLTSIAPGTRQAWSYS
ncbi:conserved exported protein of unknown function [Nocardia cyriacigeorgica GUH-2]|uniref:Uncharacterized protein n=2 Tax=Nocardia cyriacigeorgica TaxID=135487 RepID=H6R136_NOCCG|nr:conserved exported protein of unknown function [Nocardia cyriacigeorgica GUH-2]